jgi:ankyrin repeat protein
VKSVLVILAFLALAVSRQEGYVDWRKAIDDGDFAAFKRIAESRPTLEDSFPVDPQQVLEAAVDRRNLRAIRFLESRGLALTIDQAAALNDLPRVEALLKEKPSLAKLPNRPLFGATENGDLEMTKLLLRHGADPNVDLGAINVTNLTPLSEALGYRYHEPVAIELLKAGAKPHVAAGKNHPDLVPSTLRHAREPLVRAMIAAKADPYAHDWAYGPPLHWAAMKGDVDRVSLLIKLGVDPNRAARSGLTPLLAATMNRRFDAARALLEAGAKLDAYSAAALGRREVVRAAVTRDPKLLQQAESVTRNPILYYAAMCGDAAFIRDLIRRGADSSLPCYPADFEGRLPSSDRDWDEARIHLLAAIAQFASQEVVAAVIESHKFPAEQLRDALKHALRARQWGAATAVLSQVRVKDLTSKQLVEILEWLPLRGASPGLELLLNAGLDPNTELRNGALLVELLRGGDDEAAALLARRGARIGFEAAVRLGRVELVKKFLEENSALATQPFPFQPEGEEANQTPGEAVALAGRADVLRELLGRKPRLSKEAVGKLVYQAAREGHVGVLQVLADSGADVAMALRASDWWEPTIVVALYGARPEVVRWLVERRIDVNGKGGREYGTPLHQVLGYSFDLVRDFDDPPDRDARPKGKRWAEIFRLLLDAGANINARDATGQTPLHEACNGDNVEGVRELLKRGADTAVEDHNGRTPLDVARLSGRNILRSAEHRAEIIAILRARAGKASPIPSRAPGRR